MLEQKIPTNFARHIFEGLIGRVSLAPTTPNLYVATLHAGLKQRPIGHISIAPDGRYVDSRGLCGGIGWDSIHAAINGLIYADYQESTAKYTRRNSPPEQGDHQLPINYPSTTQASPPERGDRP